jgi:hypothetical protein
MLRADWPGCSIPGRPEADPVWTFSLLKRWAREGCLGSWMVETTPMPSAMPPRTVAVTMALGAASKVPSRASMLPAWEAPPEDRPEPTLAEPVIHGGTPPPFLSSSFSVDWLLMAFPRAKRSSYFPATIVGSALPTHGDWAPVGAA